MKQRKKNLHSLLTGAWFCFVWLAWSMGGVSCSDELETESPINKESRSIRFFAGGEKNKEGSRAETPENAVLGRQTLKTNDENWVMKQTVTKTPTLTADEWQSRATTPEQSHFYDTYHQSGFGAYAYTHSDGKASSSGNALMNNQKVGWVDIDTGWKPEGADVPWPESGYVSFFCYAPYKNTELQGNTMTDDNHIFKFDYTVSNEVAQANWLEILSVASSTQESALNTYVTLRFQPVMSTICFTLGGDLLYMIQTVQSIKLTHMRDKLICTFDKDGTYTITSEESVEGGVEYEVKEEENNVYLNLPPQAQMHEDAQFIMEYTGTDNQQRKLFVSLDQLNKGNDYVWKPGHTYTYTLTTKGNELVQYQGEANCYMIDAKYVNDYDQTFALPLSQAVKGWNRVKEIASPEGVSIDDMLTNLKNKDLNWTVETSWVGTNPNTLQIDGEVCQSTSEDAGITDELYLKLDFMGAAQNGYNAVVSLKLNDVVYWSWHLWFTDYKPYKVNNPKNNVAGQVHQYFGHAFTGEKGIYTSRYMMDRNLGATITEVGNNQAISSNQGEGFLVNSSNNDKFKGLYYQFGRKDPFASGLVKDTDTKELQPSNDNVAESILSPRLFFTNGTGVWTENSTDSKAKDLWNAETKLNDGVEKSVFDPCPEGWRVPSGGTDAFVNPWAGFRDGNPEHTDNGASTSAYFKWVNSIGYLYKYSNNTDNANPTIAWYPVTGYLSNSNGALAYPTNGYCWSATPSSDAVKAFNLTFTSGGVYPSSEYSRSVGLPVRCVREK